MADNVGADQLAIIRVEGMHCHRCEQPIQAALLRQAGVHEVEVDFNTARRLFTLICALFMRS